MNHYLRNLVAKNLHQVEVIRPRLASRFEPIPQNNWPNIRQMRDQEWEEKREESRTSSVSTSFKRDTAQQPTILGHAFSSSEQDSLGHAPSVNPATSKAVRMPSRYRRILQPVAEAKSLFPSFEQREIDRSNDTKASQFANLPHDITMAVRSAIPVSPRKFDSHRKDTGRGIILKSKHIAGSENKRSAETVSFDDGGDNGAQILPGPSFEGKDAEKSIYKKRLSIEEIMPFKSVEELAHSAPKKEKRKASESSFKQNEKEKAKSELGMSRKEIAHLKSVEELAHSPEKGVRILLEPTYEQKKTERSTFEKRLSSDEIVPSRSSEKKEKRKDQELDTQYKKNERIPPVEPQQPLIAPRMIVAQPIVKSYFQPEKREIEEKTTSLETKPEVLVTIGRIEVRAMSLATISQRKREKPPVMSLEDYLKNKRGGL